MAVVFERTKGLTPISTHYCPGCTHGIIHRLTAEAMEELGVLDQAIGVAPVGCSVLAYKYFNCDMHEAAHGRAPAVATGIKRVLPDKFVFTYQGDGDLASIGTAEIVHAAHRSENISVVFVNNAIYGMTGGQMAPTTLAGQRTTTSPLGRDPAHAGYPIRISEMLATIPGATFIERVAVDSPANVRKAKRAIKRAFEIQLEGKGFSLVEVLSTCPTNWGIEPPNALKWLKENMIPYYPLGNFRDATKEEVSDGQ
ncbi:MAG TPA: 2-oxoglutarate oxidoreductase [Tissierellia bacterium]|jgi:2-oxoglutarate ferredoxin oxidoreductase subunit beta|nr:2-oxoglutarate oxidoreductase [Tissierellia bacterium]